MLSEMPHRPVHAPVGSPYPGEAGLHPGHVWDCRACVRVDPSLDFGVRGCHRCEHRDWTTVEGEGQMDPTRSAEVTA